MIPILRHDSRNGLLPRGPHRAWVAEVHGTRLHLVVLGHGELVVDLPEHHGLRDDDDAPRWADIEIVHVARGDTIEAALTKVVAR